MSDPFTPITEEMIAQAYASDSRGSSGRVHEGSGSIHGIIKVMSINRDEDRAVVPVGVLRAMARQIAQAKERKATSNLQWTALGGGDQEASENGYTMRIEMGETMEETRAYWRVGVGAPDDDPRWLVDGWARTQASARRVARGVARLLWKEAERREARAIAKMVAEGKGGL